MSVLVAIVAGIVAASYAGMAVLDTQPFLWGWKRRFAAVTLVGWWGGIVALAVLVPLAVLR